MRLIDADSLPLGAFVEPRTEWHEGWNDALYAAKDAAPTVDAVEVVHGRWISVEARPHLIYECSICGDRWAYGEMLNCNFCPNCGAKMDGDENG